MAAKTKFRGSYTALVTPFKNGSLDEAAFRNLVNWQITEGTHGLVPVGTTGESPTVSHDEHKRVVEWCIDEAKGRVPVIAGAGSNSTKEAIELAQHAEQAGANAVLVVTPYYNKPTQEGMYQHFKAINDAIGIPIIIYNIPPRSVIDMSVDTMARLWELKNIAGVKDATASMVRVSQQRAAMGEDFNQLSGEDATILGYMAHGGHGCISVTSNVAPRLCSEFQAAWAKGAHATALLLLCLFFSFDAADDMQCVHLGDLERRAAPVLGVPGRLGEGRPRHRAEAARQADAAAQQPLHREQSGADQVRDVAARQAGRDAAVADGAGVRTDPRCGAQRHGTRWPDQLTRQRGGPFM